MRACNRNAHEWRFVHAPENKWHKTLCAHYENSKWALDVTLPRAADPGR